MINLQKIRLAKIVDFVPAHTVLKYRQFIADCINQSLIFTLYRIGH